MLCCALGMDSKHPELVMEANLGPSQATPAANKQYLQLKFSWAHSHVDERLHPGIISTCATSHLHEILFPFSFSPLSDIYPLIFPPSLAKGRSIPSNSPGRVLPQNTIHPSGCLLPTSREGWHRRHPPAALTASTNRLPANRRPNHTRIGERSKRCSTRQECQSQRRTGTQTTPHPKPAG